MYDSEGNYIISLRIKYEEKKLISFLMFMSLSLTDWLFYGEKLIGCMTSF